MTWNIQLRANHSSTVTDMTIMACAHAGARRNARSVLRLKRALGQSFARRQRRRDLGRPIAYSNRSTLRRLGNSFIHKKAIAMVPTPPNMTAGTAPNSAAVRPLSNSPS